MQRFEYKVVPAPRRGEKGRGLKTTEDRFAFALSHLMNDLGQDGWDYVRADTLPCDERVGLTGSKTTYQTVLVFRRPLPGGAGAGAGVEGAVGAEAGPGAARAGLSVAPAAGPAPRLGAALEPPAGAAPSLGPAPRGDAGH
jgi:hypothetical protein